MRRTSQSFIRNAALALLVLLLAIAAEAPGVTIAWSPVGNPGNAADTAVALDGTSGYGSVPYAYSIGTYDVTNSQYVDFLNAKDPTGANTLVLYNANMSAAYGGIKYTSGNAIGNKYSVIPGDGDHPANFVTFYDALRFANWMNNGQGNASTETGSYTLLGGTTTPSNGLSVTRNPGATVFIPDENEWYKASYYNPATNTYFKYPTSSNTAPTASAPTGAINSANYNDVTGYPTDVGAYTGTTSPYGAFDLGGNVYQWIDNKFVASSSRGLRGGYFYNSGAFLLSSERYSQPGDSYNGAFGFRLATIASVPEPGSIALAALGLVSLAAWGWRRRK